MKPALIEFDRALRDLRTQIARYRTEEKLLALDVSGTSVGPEAAALVGELRGATDHYSFKVANYSAVVVLLYAAFEQYIDKLLPAAVMQRVASTPRYADLPKDLQSSHRRRTIEALGDAAWMNRTGQSVERLAECLHLCESESASYRPNALVFARHNLNYRQEVLGSSLRDVGTADMASRLCSAHRLKTFEFERGRAQSPSQLLQFVNDLAERRNDVAHGQPADILSLDDLDLLVVAMWTVGVATFELLCEDLVVAARAGAPTDLGPITNIHYRSVTILDLSSLTPAEFVTVGDVAVMLPSRSTKTTVKCGRVASLRVDGEDVSQVRAAAGQSVGAGFTFELREGARLQVGRGVAGLDYLADGLPIQELLTSP